VVHAEARRRGSAEVRKCGSAEVRKCGGAEVRRSTNSMEWSRAWGLRRVAGEGTLEKANAPEASWPPGRLWVGRESKKLKQLSAHPALQRERPWLFR